MSDCLSCGTCCFSELAEYVRVTGDDHARLGERASDLVGFDGTRAFMRMAHGHCAALVVEPDGRFVCSVYERRPTTCRELERGSPQCEAEIALKGERPRVRLATLRRA